MVGRLSSFRKASIAEKLVWIVCELDVLGRTSFKMKLRVAIIGSEVGTFEQYDENKSLILLVFLAEDGFFEFRMKSLVDSRTSCSKLMLQSGWGSSCV